MLVEIIYHELHYTVGGVMANTSKQPVESFMKTKSSLISKNITIFGHRTSVRLEPEMWSALKDISSRESCTVHDLCSLVQFRKGKNTSLTAAIRVFLMLYYKAASTEEGHQRAGHGNFENMKARAGITSPHKTLAEHPIAIPSPSSSGNSKG